MTFEDGRWVLVEFVGGPGDGRARAIDGSTVVDLANGLVDLFNGAPGYRPIRAPGPLVSLDQWAERERSAISSFDRGSPDLYIQMVWSQDGGSPPPTANRRTHRARVNGDNDNERFLEMLVLGEEERARSVVRGALDGGTSITGLIETILAPAMAATGDGWAAGQLTVAMEHRATSIVRRLVAEHTPPSYHRSRGRVIVTALAHDQHSLPTEMATAALREHEWTVENLGAGLPAEELLNGGSAVGDADLLVLTVTMESNRRHSIETAALLREQGLQVLVGGPGQPVSSLQRAAEAALRS